LCVISETDNLLLFNQEHPEISKADKKKICSLIDAKKISIDASMHATQNDRLPLRLVVQVLFFQQLRAGASKELAQADDSANACSRHVQDQCEPCERPIPKHPNSLTKQVTSISARESEHRISEHRVARNSFKDHLGSLLMQSRSRRIFDKMWSSKGPRENGKGSEISGSSQSPPLSAKPTEVKPSSLPSLRNRRYSVS
jgi:hypothetical protein